MTETTEPVFSPDAEEEQRLRQQTLRAAETLAAGGEVGCMPVVVANLLAMYERDVRLIPSTEVDRLRAENKKLKYERDKYLVALNGELDRRDGMSF